MKKLLDLKLFGLVVILTVALVFIGVDFIESQVKTQGKPPNPPGQDKPDKPGKSKTEWIEFTGDLDGGQPVDGCCPNAGPFPPYHMCLNFEVGGFLAGTCHDGQLFMNVLGGRRTDGQYKVQFWTEGCEVAIEIRGGVIDFDKRNRILTVTFEDELCVDMCTGSIITEVNFTLVRRAY